MAPTGAMLADGESLTKEMYAQLRMSLYQMSCSRRSRRNHRPLSLALVSLFRDDGSPAGDFRGDSRGPGRRTDGDYVGHHGCKHGCDPSNVSSSVRERPAGFEVTRNRK